MAIMIELLILWRNIFKMIAKALSSASDFDLQNFRIIMSKYIKVQEDDSKQVVYDEELTDNINALNTTALWASI